MAEKETSTLQSQTQKQANNPLSRKLNKILETRLDNDKEMLDALKSLSLFFTENNLRSRRNLRSDIERRSLAINEEFVDNFRKIKEQLDSVYGEVKEMNECCQDMTSRLKAAKEQTHDLIDQTNKLQSQSNKLSVRAQVADTFLARFQLKPEELIVLRGTREGDLHPSFFDVLERVKCIHNDCKVLLRTNQQTAGLEIMESMAMHQESAFERLYRWTQNECRSLTSASPDISPQLCRAVSALSDRPVLLKYSLDEYGTARRTAIVRGFVDALTRGGASGTPRPIELHSHDPMRYIGDMMAWLHQGTASEKEHLQALLKDSTSQKLESDIQLILGHITEGLCRPLKVRVEQVLVSDPGAVTLYRVANLLNFYTETISSTLNESAALLTTISEMQSLGLKMFFTSLNVHTNRLLEKVEVPPAELEPTTSLTQSLQLLRDILSSHGSSVVSIDSKKQDFAQIIKCMVDPLIQICSLSASNLNSVDMATYMINCLHLIQTTLALYEFTGPKIEMLQAQIEAHVDTLVSEQASFILAHVAMSQIYATVQQNQAQEQGPLSRLHATSANLIKQAMVKFDGFLSSPDSLTLTQCTLLISSNLRDNVKKATMNLICQAFKLIHTAVFNADNAYTNPAAIVPRTPEQVQELLT